MEWKINETLEYQNSPILKKNPKYQKLVSSSVQLPLKLLCNQIVSYFVA